MVSLRHFESLDLSSLTNHLFLFFFRLGFSFFAIYFHFVLGLTSLFSFFISFFITPFHNSFILYCSFVPSHPLSFLFTITFIFYCFFCFHFCFFCSSFHSLS